MSHQTRAAGHQAISLTYKMNDDPPVTPLGSLHDEFDAVRPIVQELYPWQPDSYARGRDEADNISSTGPRSFDMGGW